MSLINRLEAIDPVIDRDLDPAQLVREGEAA